LSIGISQRSEISSRALLALFLVIAIVLLNFPGTRFPHQDYMLNDLWAIGRLNFFSASLLDSPFAVLRFSEGFGVDIRSDIKTQTSFYDPAFWFVIFFDPWISLALRQIIFLVIGTQGLYSLLRHKGIVDDHALVMSSLFGFSLLWYSETSSLTTNTYSLLPFVLYSYERLKANPTVRNTLLLSGATLFFVGNLDLNILFIVPVIGFWMLFYELEDIKQGKIRPFVFLTLIVCCASAINLLPLVIQKFTTEISLSHNSLSFDGLFAVSRGLLEATLKSLLVPSVVGPITLHVFGPLLFFLFTSSSRIHLWAASATLLISVLLFLTPLLLKVVAENSPSYIRYHFGVVAFLIYISACYAFNEHILKAQRLSKWQLRWFWILVVIIGLESLRDALLIPYGVVAQSVGIGICVWLVGSVMGFDRRFPAFLLVPVMFLGLFANLSGGLKSGNVRFTSHSLKEAYIGDLGACVRAVTGGNSVVLAADNPQFPDEGRNDLLIPLLELPEHFAGRTFFQWRHSYPEITSKLYLKSGAAGNHAQVAFWPPSSSASKQAGFVDFVNLTKSNYIVSAGLDFVHPDWVLRKRCSLTPDDFGELGDLKYLWQEMLDTFLLNMTIYERTEKFLPEITYTPTTVRVRPEYQDTEHMISVPILFSPSLVASDDSVRVEKAPDGLVNLVIPQSWRGQIIEITSFDRLKYLQLFLLPVHFVFGALAARLLFSRRRECEAS
jgi:hypothetical protein